MSTRLLRNMVCVAMRGSKENDMLQKGGPPDHNGNVVTLRSFFQLAGFLCCLLSQITCTYHFAQFSWW
jgi:hypothetical protein